MPYNSPQGYLPSAKIPTVLAQTVSAASDTISIGSSMSPIVVVNVTCSGGAITLTSTPNIQAGKFDGQVVYIMNDKDTAGGLTFSDESGVPGSLMRLVGATLAINARDIVGFMWHSDSGAWTQMYARLNVL